MANIMLEIFRRVLFGMNPDLMYWHSKSAFLQVTLNFEFE